MIITQDGNRIKPRIRWISGQGWTILHMNLGFDDLSLAYDVAVGKAWMTPRSITDTADALAYGFARAETITKTGQDLIREALDGDDWMIFGIDDDGEEFVES